MRAEFFVSSYAREVNLIAAQSQAQPPTLQKPYGTLMLPEKSHKNSGREKKATLQDEERSV
jgi:hypothetical protein